MILPKNASRDITATTDCDHEIGAEFIQDLLGRGLAQLVHLYDSSCQTRIPIRFYRNCVEQKTGPRSECQNNRSNKRTWL